MRGCEWLEFCGTFWPVGFVNWYQVYVVSGEILGAQEMGSGWNLTMGMFIGFFLDKERPMYSTCS